MVLNGLEKKVVVIGIHKKEYVPKGSSESKILYQLGVATEDGEVGMIRCNESVAQTVSSDGFKKYTEHKISCVFNDQYDSFSVESVS